MERKRLSLDVSMFHIHLAGLVEEASCSPKDQRWYVDAVADRASVYSVAPDSMTAEEVAEGYILAQLFAIL